jgi:hypothetical protein
MGLKVDEKGKTDLNKGKMSVEGLRMLGGGEVAVRSGTVAGGALVLAVLSAGERRARGSGARAWYGMGQDLRRSFSRCCLGRTSKNSKTHLGSTVGFFCSMFISAE